MQHVAAGFATVAAATGIAYFLAPGVGATIAIVSVAFAIAGVLVFAGSLHPESD
jgi:hypothetical protein